MNMQISIIFPSHHVINEFKVRRLWMFSAQEGWRCQQPLCRMRSFLSPSTISVCARRSLRVLGTSAVGQESASPSNNPEESKKVPPGNARSSENAHRTRAFVKYELLAAHQNTLRNTVCGLEKIEFYWLWGPRRLRNWFYEISVKLCHWFLACLWAKNTLLTTKHANPSSHPGSKPRPVLRSGSRVSDLRLQFSEFFYLILNNSARFFQKKTQTNKTPQSKQKTLPKIYILILYLLYLAIQKCCN